MLEENSQDYNNTHVARNLKVYEQTQCLQIYQETLLEVTLQIAEQHSEKSKTQHVEKGGTRKTYF